MKLIFIISVLLAVITINNINYSSENNVNYPVYADSLSKCPVTGDDVSGEHIAFRYIDKDFKFCNEGCLMAFKKDPAKYSEHIKCMPCDEDDSNVKISTVHNGVKYYFCGEGCKKKFDDDSEKYLDKYKIEKQK